jgi:hypothetical protein
MDSRAFLLLLCGFLFGSLVPAHAEPKAYELVKYHGKSGGATIAFDYGDGYPEASVLKITTGGKTSTFNLSLDDSGAAKFNAANTGGPVKSVTLKFDPNESGPERIKGSYIAGGKPVPFTLTKSK